MKPYLLLLFCFLMLQACAQQPFPKLIKIEDVNEHIGDSVTIKGQVFNVIQDEFSHPCLIITNSFPLKFALIFPAPSNFDQYKPYDLKNIGLIYFTGKIQKYKGVEIMKIYNPEQIKLSSAQLLSLTAHKLVEPLSEKERDSVINDAEKIKKPVLDTQ